MRTIPHAKAIVGLLGLSAIAAAAAGCLGPDAASDLGRGDDADATRASGDLGVVTGAVDGGASTAFDVTVSAVTYGCSAAFACRDDFLFDPDSAARAPSVMTTLSCGFAADSAPYDALLSFHGEIACYAGGDATEPESWEPEGGVPITLDHHHQLFFSNHIGAAGDAYTNWGALVDAIQTANNYPFCELRGYGFFQFDLGVEGPRTARVDRWPTIIEWRGVVDFSTGGYDCHTYEGGVSRVDRRVIAAAIHDRALPADKGSFPASFDWALIDEVARATEVPPDSGDVYEHDGLHLIVGTDAAFPAPSDATLPGYLTRSLWVMHPALGEVPADIRAGTTCIGEDGEGFIQTIAVEVTDPDHIPLGAIVLHAEVDGEPFECERDDYGACLLVPQISYESEARCLLEL